MSDSLQHISIDGYDYYFFINDIPEGELRSDVKCLLESGKIDLVSYNNTQLGDGFVLTSQEIRELHSLLLPLNQRSAFFSEEAYSKESFFVDLPSLESFSFQTYGSAAPMHDGYWNLDSETQQQMANLWYEILDLSAVKSAEYFSVDIKRCEPDDTEKFYIVSEQTLTNGNVKYSSATVCYEEKPWSSNPILPIVKSYYNTYQNDFENAVSILAKHHPELPVANLRLLLLHLLTLELTLYDAEIDVWQDLAAARHAESARLSVLESVFEDQGYMTYLFSTWAGDDIWVIASSFEWVTDSSVAIGKQGLGAWQVKTDLLEQAFFNPKVFNDYKPYVSEKNLANEKARIRTALDPQLSIYAKAMVLDLQLTQFHNKNVYLSGVGEPPFISDYETSHQLAIMRGASRLVQFPNHAPTLSQSLRLLYTNGYIYDFYILADFLELDPPELNDLTTYQAEQCASEFREGIHTYYFRRTGESTTCFISSKNPDFFLR